MNQSIDIGHFESALRVRFKHASASQSATNNVIVRITDENGLAGYGEGCPRHYVTGETPATVTSFLHIHGKDIIKKVESVESLRDWIGNNSNLINTNPSAFCAIELALLDLLSRQKHQPIEALLGLAPPSEPLHYTAVMGNSRPGKMRLMSWAYQLYGLRDFKVKLSGDPLLDNVRLNTLPAKGNVRLDANNLWQYAEDCIACCSELDRQFWAIEEPVCAFDTDSMTTIAMTLNCKIILGESLLHKQHLSFLDNHNKKHFVANIRVSKCGGILRATELANKCQAAGIDVIIGAHVGETSLLTRAAICVGQGLKLGLGHAPIAREGAYGTILLEKDISSTSIRFGKNGIIAPVQHKVLKAKGFGIEVDANRVHWLNA